MMSLRLLHPQDRDPSSIEEFLANEESDSVYVNSRRAVYMELQVCQGKLHCKTL